MSATPSTTPLAQLLARPDAQSIQPENVDAFLATPGSGVLVFPGDPARRPEAQDVAVVVRELTRMLPHLRVGVASLPQEAALRKRFEIAAVPTVVFVQRGKAAATVERLADWETYARTAAAVFDPQEAP